MHEEVQRGGQGWGIERTHRQKLRTDESRRPRRGAVTHERSKRRRCWNGVSHVKVSSSSTQQRVTWHTHGGGGVVHTHTQQAIFRRRFLRNNAFFSFSSFQAKISALTPSRRRALAWTPSRCLAFRIRIEPRETRCHPPSPIFTAANVLTVHCFKTRSTGSPVLQTTSKWQPST
jgi:hypothetical protein